MSSDSTSVRATSPLSQSSRGEIVSSAIGLGADFQRLPVSEQIGRLAELHSEQHRRLNSHDAQLVQVKDSLRDVQTDLADCRRQYAKYCVKVSGQGVPKPVPGEDSCDVLWTLMKRKYGLEFQPSERAQVCSLFLCCGLVCYFVL